MSTKQLDHITATRFDSLFRYQVTSRTRPHDTHLCELDTYKLNGRCSCEHFEIRLEGLLRRGITPELALAAKLVTLKRKDRPDKDPRDALRCDHLIEAWRQFSYDTASTILDIAETHETRERRKPEAKRIQAQEYEAARRAVIEDTRTHETADCGACG